MNGFTGLLIYLLAYLQAGAIYVAKASLGTHHVDQADLEFGYPPASAFTRA